MIYKFKPYKVRESGNGLVVTIPSLALKALDVKAHDFVEMHLSDDALIITKKLDPIFAGLVAPMRGNHE